ncbi:MAG TPA: SMP-30/gluconolactonase/LRE family protein [Anaeromyxobacteraceae bacterium]|nr:SMP-30/gluconolactonase/LRE family protein [Anaeromyxobacteraceae bacterium]
MHSAPLHARRPTALAALPAAVALAFATACATTASQKKDEVVWPLPPDKPRVKYVRSLSSEKDLRQGSMDKVWRALVPADPDLVVKEPTGLALSADEKKLFVACAPRGRVLEFDLEARRVRAVANPEGYRPAQPFAVALDAAGNLYVTDPVGAAIWVYGPDGKFLRQMGKPFLERPTGLAIDRKRQVLYAVDGGRQATRNHKVEVFALGGEHLRTIGTRGPAPGEFNFPNHVAVAPDGNVYVSDMLNFRIQVFDPQGALVAFFGASGVAAPGVFQKLKGLAFDSFGNLHAVDTDAAIVQMFNARHQPLMAYGGPANRVEFMAAPTAIAISSRNEIYVADYMAGRVNEYVLFGTTAEDSFAPAR